MAMQLSALTLTVFKNRYLKKSTGMECVQEPSLASISLQFGSPEKGSTKSHNNFGETELSFQRPARPATWTGGVCAISQNQVNSVTATAWRQPAVQTCSDLPPPTQL